jgi:hypothetical protein
MGDVNVEKRTFLLEYLRVIDFKPCGADLQPYSLWDSSDFHLL